MGKQGTLTKAEMQVMNILWSLPSMKGTISDEETGLYYRSHVHEDFVEQGIRGI